MAYHILESAAVEISAGESVVGKNIHNANIGITAHKVKQQFALIFDAVAFGLVAVVP
jgi:hypothetical protein